MNIKQAQQLKEGCGKRQCNSKDDNFWICGERGYLCPKCRAKKSQMLTDAEDELKDKTFDDFIERLKKKLQEEQERALKGYTENAKKVGEEIKIWLGFQIEEIDTRAKKYSEDRITELIKIIEELK